MILILIFSIAVLLGVSFFGWYLLENDHDGAGACLMVIPGGINMILVIVLIIFSVSYISAPVQAKLLNQTYGTHYTTEDLIWGGDIIRETIQGDRHRIDLTVNEEK